MKKRNEKVKKITILKGKKNIRKKKVTTSYLFFVIKPYPTS